MIFLFAVLFPVAEIALTLAVIREYGFANAFFAWLAATILGFGLIRTSGLRLTVGVAQAMREGKPPGAAALESALIGLAGLLLLIPGYISDVVALGLLIPPLRRLMVKQIAKAVAARTVTAAQKFAGPWSQSPNTENASPVDASSAIIDVEAVEIRDTEK